MNERFLSFIAVALFLSPFIVSGTHREPTRQTMLRIFEAVRVVLPLSVDDKRFEDPALEPEIRQSLGLLAEKAAVLREHSGSADLGFEYLGRSLADYAADANRQYRAGRYESVQALVKRMTNLCVACHSRLPSLGDSPLAQGFVSQKPSRETAAQTTR